MTDFELIKKAIKAMDNSYAPYSGFNVGAALLTKSGEVICGANIENSAYSLSLCAERVAVANALMDGKKDFKGIAIVGGRNKEITQFCPPCGACRQVLDEFCDGDFKMILWNGNEIKAYTLNELLPFSFGRDKLC